MYKSCNLGSLIYKQEGEERLFMVVKKRKNRILQITTESEKSWIYMDLAKKLKNISNLNMSVIKIIGSFEQFHRDLEKWISETRTNALIRSDIVVRMVLQRCEFLSKRHQWKLLVSHGVKKTRLA